MHLSSVITNGDIGENFTVYPNTLIGKTPKGNNKAPVIGNSVTVYTGATVIGNVTIANGIKIAAGAVVNKSFTDENILIGGIPAKVLSKS